MIPQEGIMIVQRLVLAILLLSSTTVALAQEKAKTPFMLFKPYISETDKPDMRYVHPVLKNARVPFVVVSIQEHCCLRNKLRK